MGSMINRLAKGDLTQADYKELVEAHKPMGGYLTSATMAQIVEKAKITAREEVTDEIYRQVRIEATLKVREGIKRQVRQEINREVKQEMQREIKEEIKLEVKSELMKDVMEKLKKDSAAAHKSRRKDEKSGPTQEQQQIDVLSQLEKYLAEPSEAAKLNPNTHEKDAELVGVERDPWTKKLVCIYCQHTSKKRSSMRTHVEKCKANLKARRAEEAASNSVEDVEMESE